MSDEQRNEDRPLTLDERIFGARAYHDHLARFQSESADARLLYVGLLEVARAVERLTAAIRQPDAEEYLRAPQTWKGLNDDDTTNG